MGFFAILFLLHRITSPFFQATHGFSLAKGALRCHLCLSAHFSTPREDTSSVVSIVIMRVLSLFGSSRIRVGVFSWVMYGISRAKTGFLSGTGSVNARVLLPLWVTVHRVDRITREELASVAE